MKWLLFLLPFRLLAQIQCDASVDRNVIEQFSRFQLTITLRGTSLNITSLPQIPELSGMRIDRNSVSESTQMSFVNFKKSEEHSFTYAIQAEQIGRWTIPPITIYNDGQPLSTHTITVEIIAAGDPSSAQDPANKKVEAFLELSFSKKTAVLGEQIVAEVNVYSKHPIRNFNPINFPSFRGFWAEDFTLPQRIEPSRKTIGGSTFLVYTIKKTAIFGQRVGTFTIEPCVMEFEIAVPRRTGGFMDNFFSPFNDPLGETVTIRLSPPPENISIGDLPPDAPLDFSGLVGSFEIKNSLDHDKIKVGEAISYQIEISGQGNIRESILLKNPFPGVFETYDPKISDEIKIKGELLGGKKVIEFIAIPRQEGEYDVAPFSLCYFDPKQKKYVTKTVNKKQLSVSKGAHPAESSPVVSKVDTVRGRSESVDLLIIKDIVFWATVVLLPIGGIVIIWLNRKKWLSRLLYTQKPRVLPSLAIGIKSAESLLKKNQVLLFYSEIQKLLMDVVPQEVGNISTRDTAEKHLVEKGATAELIAQWKSALEKCDRAKYSVGESPTDTTKFLEETKGLLNHLRRLTS